MSSNLLENENQFIENENENEKNELVIELQLGDIINISNPKNDKINNQIFLIDYIDKTKMYLINTDTLDKIKLKINEEGIIGDGNITQISILSRNDVKGYARQNGLLSGKWINIYFGGDYPVIITGEITNLEEDMIEIKTIDNDVIYINFDYKGIPEDLPIDNIEIREKPESVTKKDYEVEEEEQEEQEEQEIGEMPELEKERIVIPTEKIQIDIPIQNVKDQLREFILRADQIKFGDEELGPIIQFVDVSDQSQRYSIETQLTDLLDELLSTIPNNQRTPRVLNDIHIMIERFKQLRERFSKFDQYGVVSGTLINEANYRPLTQYFKNFKQILYWILPVVKNVKKIYSDTTDINENNTDIITINIDNDLNNIKKIFEIFRSNISSLEQNKYLSLFTSLNPYFTPFDAINDENVSEIITQKNVENELNVIIDNLEDMYSSVFSNNNIRSRRFVIQKYNTGLTKLDTLDSTSSRLITTRIKMTNSDTMSIKSFITLPEPTIRFSKINLPGTNILDRANLNLVFLNYWEFLKKKTISNDIIIDKLDDNIEFNENNFANNIKNYILNLSSEEKQGLDNQQIYSEFIKKIIPKTRVLFELMKKYINGKLSIVDVVNYLEPFLIYTDDLTYKQYEEIIDFISTKISEFNSEFIKKSRIFSMFNRFKSENVIFTNAYSIVSLLTEKENIRKDVYDKYDIDIDLKTLQYRNSEILNKLIIKDNSKLFTTAISLQSIPLMFPSEFSNIFDEEKHNISKKIEDEEKTEEDQCKTFIIAKYYTSLDDLNQDNDRQIYFDKKYDNTNYGLLDNYEKEIIKMDPEELRIYITNDLMKKQHLNEKDADYLANTLLDGYKKVLQGNYAILYKGYKEKYDEEIDYYVRKSDKWELDNSVKNVVKNVNTDDSNILCSLQEKCIVSDVNDKCESMKVDELTLQNELLKEVINEFDTKYRVSKEEFEKNIKEQFNYFMFIIDITTRIENNNILKYSNQKYKLGSSIDDENGSVRPISPNEELLELILSQKDFVKKQHDIIRFVNTYTRPAIEGYNILNEPETKHWLYCIKTSVRLLPTFKYDMATAYITNPSGFKGFLDILKSKIGKLSDEGDWWIDENSGWPIVKTDFDVEEGYEEGFKVSTRAVLEEDAGNKILSATNKTVKYDTPETIMVSNIVNAVSIAMGINIETQKEFIMNCVLTSLRDTLESESEYKEIIKKKAAEGKKIMSYNDYYNSAFIYYTLGSYLIAVQTSIPSVKTRKTHPGCIRSFSGYPFEGTGDYSSLNYLACIAYDIRKSGEPWNVLKGKKIDYITNKIKAAIDGVLLSNPDVQRKLEEKTNYLLTSPSEEIPLEHDIKKWSQFLPPLVPFKITNLVNISDEFKRTLMSELRSGSEKQRERLLVLDSKIIQFSLALQERIQEVVKKQNLLLHNSNNEPYLENACCESKDGETTIGYFTKHDPRITEYNNIVSRLKNIIDDVVYYSKGGLLYSNINTKNKYPPLSNDFDEKTIYLSFIYFCKFKSLLPVPEDLLPLCSDKPDHSMISPNDSLDRIIQKLKDDGRNYNNDTFLRLLQLVGRNNIVNINLNTQLVSPITKLTNLLESINDENDDIVEGSLIKLLTNAMDTFDIASSEITKEIKDLNNFLVKHTEEMKSDIIEFAERNRSAETTKSSLNKMKNAILNLSNWSSDNSTRNENIKISNDNMYNSVNFYKTFIENMITIFPDIILNKVNYKDTYIPSYHGFSSNHNKKLQKYINDYYENLKEFQGMNQIYNILTAIKKSCINLLKLSKETPCFTTIKYGEKVLKPIFDERTSRLLYEYYLLKVFITYIDLTDEDNMIVNEIKEKNEVTDIFSIEFLEEQETKTDVIMTNRSESNTLLLSGNKKDLRQKITRLIIAYTNIMNKQKDLIDYSYEDIQDRIFKLKEKEKDRMTDRLKLLTEDERDVDTALKINKLANYSIGLQKGLTSYERGFYDQEEAFREDMERAERAIRRKTGSTNELDVDQLEQYLEEQRINREIENEAYDMNYINEDFFNGNTDGVGAPEEEYDDYQNYDS